MKIERRSLNQEFRVSDDAQPTISGYAAIFDSPTDFGGMWNEIVDPHAFDGVLKQDIRGLFNHCPDHVLGRTTAGTMSVSVDGKGLTYTITPPDTQLARDLIVSMRRKDITGSSFGFICARDQWTDESDGSVTRRILEVSELLDCSVVTYPAYDAATSGVRSLPDSMPVEMRSRFEQRSDKPKTKHVDGEDLTSDCFLIVGDPDKTDTWKLPWKFSTDDKTKSHLRNALARIDQVKGVSEDDLKAAKNKLADLCKQYGIDTESKSIRALTDQCTCPCPQCLAGSCGICSADPQCEGAERNSIRSTDDEWREVTMLRLRVAESE